MNLHVAIYVTVMCFGSFALGCVARSFIFDDTPSVAPTTVGRIAEPEANPVIHKWIVGTGGNWPPISLGPDECAIRWSGGGKNVAWFGSHKSAQAEAAKMNLLGVPGNYRNGMANEMPVEEGNAWFDKL